MQLNFRINTSSERIAIVRQEIERGSEPRPQFYSMVAISTGIAAFGLIMNNTAVVIGAMLVAPLMTPIFGIALALVRGDAALLGRSIRAEVAGVFLSVLMAICIGFLIPELDVTDEMLGRTAPNLLDLLVAIFAGTAGAYAMVDERISPALPGVAISTAIVPPLANTGLCIKLEAFQGAIGSFLLFFANFLSILLVASVIFFAAGMARELRKTSKKDIFRRFGLTAIGFILMATFLSVELNLMAEKRHLEDVINAVLAEELAKLPATSIQEIRHEKRDEIIYILAHVHSPTMFSPARVKKIQSRINAMLGQPTQLFLRSTLTQDVTATGAINPLINETLDGLIYNRHPNARIRTLKLAEQAVRENFARHLGLQLSAIDLLPLNNSKALRITVKGFRALSKQEIVDLEAEVRHRTGDEKINLIIEFNQLDLYDRMGRFNYEWLTLDGWTSEQEADFITLDKALQETFSNNDYYLVSLDFKVIDDLYYLVLELVGAKLYSQKELLELKQHLSSYVDKPLKIFVRSRPEIVVSEDGFTSFEKLKNEYRQQLEAKSFKEINKILDEAY